ncbi:hypothetical protein ACS0TY_035241 [Phlomoides rotata]
MVDEQQEGATVLTDPRNDGEVTAASGGSGGEGKVVVIDGGGGEFWGIRENVISFFQISEDFFRMPYPQNLETAKEVEAIVQQNGAIPATIAILDGVPC